MSIFDRMTGSGQKPKVWKELTSMESLESAEQESFVKPVVLFKHSTRCGTSAYAKERLTELPISEEYDFYYLDLITYRGISDEIARRYHVIHQSPQILILKNGKSTFTTSHHSINARAILDQVN